VIRGTFLLLFGMAFAFSIVVGSRMLILSIPSVADRPLAIAAFLTIALSAGIIATSGAALQTIYLAADLPFLLTLPIPLHATFASKFVETFVGTAPIGFIGVWFVVGYSTTTPTPLSTLGVGLAVLGAYLIVLTALGIVLVAGIARLVAPKRAWTVLGIASMTIVASLGLWWAAIRMSGASRRPGGETRVDNLTRPIGGSMVDDLLTAGEQVQWTPLAWMARTLTAVDGDRVALVGNGTLVVASVAVSCAVAWGLFAMTYAGGTTGFRTADASVPRPSRPLARWTEVGLSRLPRPLAALILKEWLAIFRDTRRLTGAIWPLGMVVVSTITLARQDAVATDPAGLGYWRAVGSLVLLPWAASLGTAAYSVGTERRGIHLLRSLPVDTRTILRAKTIAGIVPVLALTEVAAILVAVANDASPAQLGLVTLFVAWTAVGFVTLDTCASAVAPNFATDQVQRSLRIKGRLFSLVVGSVFGAGSALLMGAVILAHEGYPAQVVDLARSLSIGIDGPQWPAILLGIAGAGVLIAGGIIAASWRLAVSRLDAFLVGESG